MAHFFESLEVRSRIIVLVIVFFATLSIFYNARAFAVRTELFEAAVKRVKNAHRADNRVINGSNELTHIPSCIYHKEGVSMIRLCKVWSASIVLILVASSARASLHAMSIVPHREPVQSLPHFKPFSGVNFRDLHSQQESTMPQSIEPMKRLPQVVSPPKRRTMPTPQRSRCTLPERSLERRQLPQTEQPKAKFPEKPIRQAPPQK